MSASASAALAAEGLYFDNNVNRVRTGNRADDITAIAESALGRAINDIISRGGDDHVEATAFGLTTVRNTINTGDGHDFVLADAYGGSDVATTILTGLGNDHVEAFQDGRGPAYINAGGGRDVVMLQANGLVSTVIGGAGNDSLWSKLTGGGVNTLDGGAGRDRMEAIGSGADQFLFGRDGDDILIATSNNTGRSELYGGDGNDLLLAIGGEGNVISGGLGNDRLVAGLGEDAFRFDLATFQVAYTVDTVANFDRTEDCLELRGLTTERVLSVWDNGSDVRVEFWNGSAVIFEGMGNGTCDALEDLVDDPGQISDTWLS